MSTDEFSAWVARVVPPEIREPEFLGWLRTQGDKMGSLPVDFIRLLYAAWYDGRLKGTRAGLRVARLG